MGKVPVLRRVRGGCCKESQLAALRNEELLDVAQHQRQRRIGILCGDVKYPINLAPERGRVKRKLPQSGVVKVGTEERRECGAGGRQAKRSGRSCGCVACVR